MKLNKAIKTLLGITIAFGSFLGCRKDQQQSQEDDGLLRSITQQWYAAFIKTASIKEAASSDLILKDLDYAASYRMQSETGKSLILIKMKTQTVDGNAKFLSLAANGAVYDLDGIYEAKNITTIQRFFSSRIFPANDSIVVRSVPGNPLKAWFTDAAGNVQYKKGLGVAKGQDAKQAFIRQQTPASSSPAVGLNAEPPPPSACIAWYWIWYDPSSGVVIGMDFLGTTGDCEGDPNASGNHTSQYLHCGQYTSEQIAAMVANAYLVDVDEVSHNNGQTSTDEQGRIRKPATPTWKVMECRQGITGRYMFTAYYAGVKFRTHEQDPSWKWESFTFSSFSGSWVSMPCSISITINSLSHSETRRDDYVFDVSLAFSALVSTSVPMIPSSAERNTVGTTGKTFSFDAAL